MDQRPRKGQLLLHSMGVSGNQIPQHRIDSEILRLFPDALLSVPCRYPINVRQKIQVLNARQIFIDIRIVRDISYDLLAGKGLGAHILAVHPDLPLVEIMDAHHGLDGSGLPGTVAADKAVDVPGPHRQGQIVHRGLTAFVDLCQILDLQHFVSFLLSLPPLYCLWRPIPAAAFGLSAPSFPFDIIIISLLY